MAIEFQKTAYSGRFPEFWRGEAKVLPGGFKPAQTIANGTVVRRGTPLCVDFSQRKAYICKAGLVLTGGTTTKPRVAKGNYFAVGDRVSKVGHYGASPTISAIDTSNAAYDVLTLSAAYTGLSADDVLVEASAYGYYPASEGDEGALLVKASGASTGEINAASVTPYNGEGSVAANDYVVLKNAAPLYEPNAVVAADEEFTGKGLPTLDAAYDAVVLYPALTFPIIADWLNGFCMKSNPNILFIKQ